MKKTRILRLFFNRADGFDGGEYLPGADEEMMGSVIYPIVEGDNTRIKFLR